MMEETMLEHIYLQVLVISPLFNTPFSPPPVVCDYFNQAARYHIVGL
jgi:hypothetical protein